MLGASLFIRGRQDFDLSNLFFGFDASTDRKVTQ